MYNHALNLIANREKKKTNAERHVFKPDQTEMFK
jgi:hypothetical protein